MQDELKTMYKTKPDDSKESSTTEHCIKVWSEYSNKWRYIPKDPAYFRMKYYKYLGPKTCSMCGVVVQTQMCRHQRSQRCIRVSQQPEKLQKLAENDTTSVQELT
jgi:hypothetical protein